MEDIHLTQLELLLALWVLTVHWALQESHGPHRLTEWTGLRIHLFPLVSTSLPPSLTPC